MFEFKTEESNGCSGQAAVDGISAIEIDKSGKRFVSTILHKRITTLSIMIQYSRKFSTFSPIATSFHGEIFIPRIFLFDVNDYIEPMVTSTAWAKKLNISVMQGELGWAKFLSCDDFVHHGRLVTGTQNGQLKLWNYNNGHCIKTLDKGYLRILPYSS